MHGPANGTIELLRDDGEFTTSRTRSDEGAATQLLVTPTWERPAPPSLAKLRHAHALRGELDSAWAARPLDRVEFRGWPALLVEDPGGEFLDGLIDRPLSILQLLRLACGLAKALAGLHTHDLVHKDVKPGNFLVKIETGEAWLTGFGLTSRLPRHRQALEPPEFIAGTLAYMAPEQTGRMNRSIDSRSDLYSLGVTFYEMLVGALPFTASDPMEWVHCHIARLPVAPSLRRSEIPEPLSAIILKLLAKAPEERYQTASGVEADLRECLSALEAHGRIESFPLGAGDIPDRLLVPEKLYGRENEIEQLLTAFDRVVSQGPTELVLVSGYSGVGKSSVVNELHKALVPPRGLFASGKFDQYKRDIPYATLVQAFRSLVQPLLGKSDAELAVWRGAFLEALEPNARLMTDLIPELKLIIGDQPPVPELDPQQAQSRFQLVFRRFMGVFARPEHPLAIFLDDLQWLDAATLDLLEDLLSRSDLHYLMLIGAYRDNEVDADHPLMRRLQTVRNSGAKVDEVTLGPLAREHVEQLIADALYCEPERAAPLAALVHEKTAGNPFFVIQFLHALSEESLLRFDHAGACWSWNLDRIHAQGYTDNVVELMVGKLSRLPAETQQALQQLACLGNVAGITTLSTVLEMPEQQVHAALWEALRQELVERLEGSYRFGHDRIHEAAYSLIPRASRNEAHLRIGRLLTAQTPPEKLEEAIFEIAGQLNRGAALITSRDEREQLAEFNLLAGQRAGASTAYTSALTYLVTGVELLPDDCWERRHGLIFALELNRAACEFLTGQLRVADERLAFLSNRATTTVEQASVACLHTDVCTTLDHSDRAVAVCLDYLRQVGIEWSPHPNDAEVRREYEHIGSQLAGRAIEELIDLPLMEDAASLATAEVLTKLFAPALQTDGNLVALMSCKAVNWSLERGSCDASCFAYVLLSRVAGPRFGDYQFGFRFGQLGYDLVERRGFKRFEAKTYVCFSIFVVRWMKPVRACRDLLHRAFVAANQTGDIPYGGYARNSLNSDLLFAGEALPEAQVEAELGLAYVEKVRFGLVIDFIATQLALIRMLRGLTSTFGRLDDGPFDELRIEHHFSSKPALAVPACCYWIRKLQARYLAGDYAAAMDAAAKAQPLLWTSSSFYEEAEYHFYGALAQAACCDSALETMSAHHRPLRIWAENCPENFADRAALVGAEIARVEGRRFDAERLYEQAICLARENGFVHNEAIAHEVAARFYAGSGLGTITDAYLRNARSCYLRWGADGKVRQLDRLYPRLAAPEGQRPAALKSAIGTLVGQLDAETVARASQALSSEIVLPKLIERLMGIALEHAGAERGLLILLRGNEPFIEAEATTGHGKVDVQVRRTTVTSSDLPKSSLHYVIRTRERVVIDDASVRNLYSGDEYLEQRKARSVLCLPIIKQTNLIGVLYLENNLTPRVFTSGRVAVLDMLASQAAISLENARLYAELEQENQERQRAEEELRRSEAYLAEAQKLSCTGSFGWNVGADEHFWSDETYRIFGYDLSSKVSLQMVRERIHPEDVSLLDEVTARAAAGQGFDYECRLLLPTGEVRRVHIVAHAVHGDFGVHEFVGAVMDITTTRQAETALRQAQAELAHVTRVTTMGELAASIAHEVNQPIAGVVINGNACLRWLARVDGKSIELDEAREALQRIIRDGNRAGDIITRIRALFKKTGSAREPLDLNETIREVIVLARGEMNKHRVVLRLELSPGLPTILGDRVQLQQVLLNLMLNAIDAMTTVEGRARDLVIQTQATEAREVLTSVRDSGIGLGCESVEHIFKAFHTTKPGGLGMGLSISRSIVENHSGRLWTMGQEGPGATFQFTLPTQLPTERGDIQP